ncbi:MAG: ABC transporter permease [Myxococcales bacterium]|nr:ABC transporter permease [Myxococcales bacterium]
MRLLLAFLRRDILIAASYRLSFAFMLAGGLITLTVFYFLARTMGETALLRERYGADYFSFALVGVAVASCLRAMQTSFAGRLREAQTDGSLEVLLAAPHSTFRVIASLAAYPVATAFLRAVGLIALGWWLFGADLHLEPFSFTVTLGLALLAFGALGLLSAAFVLTFKRGDPFTYALDTATYLLAGVVYPVEVLPEALQWAAKLLPATHALSALRASALKGQGLSEVAPSLLVLALFSLALWPLAALALTLARRHVERAGTLPHA